MNCVGFSIIKQKKSFVLKMIKDNRKGYPRVTSELMKPFE